VVAAVIGVMLKEVRFEARLRFNAQKKLPIEWKLHGIPAPPGLKLHFYEPDIAVWYT
jgi:hypothetical protein